MSVVNQRKGIHPLNFALYISMGSITMMFGGFMSAYIVRQAAGNWLEFEMPSNFTISTAILILSSICIHWTFQQFKAGKENNYKIGLISTFLMGLGFIFFQYLGWTALQGAGVDLKGNPSGSFVYVISGVHVAHVLGGLAALIVALAHGFGLPFKPTPKRITRLSLTTQYWHYVDVLWIVLYLFFLYYR